MQTLPLPRLKIIDFIGDIDRLCSLVYTLKLKTIPIDTALLSLFQCVFFLLYFLYYFVAKFISYTVLLVYRTVLKLLIKNMIFEGVNASLSCILETVQSNATSWFDEAKVVNE